MLVHTWMHVLHIIVAKESAPKCLMHEPTFKCVQGAAVL